MTANRPPQCVVSFWDDDTKAFVSYAIDAQKVRQAVGNAMPLDMSVEDHDSKIIDDEFARVLGGRIIKFLSATNPAIKPLDQITTHSDA